jgi:putative aminopeptidase FrvX
VITPELLRGLLLPLTALPGIAGHEDAVARAMAAHLAPLAAAVQVDALGNVTARFGPQTGAPRLAILAHMDTVGFLVKQVRPDGTLGLVAVGGVNARALPGAEVRVGNLPGVISVRSQHLAESVEPAGDPEGLTIQVAPALAAQIEVTTPVTYAPRAVELGGGLVGSPYLDNRAGCAVLLALAGALAAEPPPCPVLLIGTVQEETTCSGAYHALRVAAPDAALFVDGTLSYDTPETQGLGAVRLGGGPVLTSFLYTRGLNGWHAHPPLRAHLKAVAEAEGIAVQQDAVRGLLSDARVAAWLGLPSALIGLPMRAKHAPLETVHLGDLVAAARLLAATVRRPLPDLSRG